MTTTVLSVGNCGFDNGSLGSWLRATFRAELLTAADWVEAKEILSRTDDDIQLVLVNRVLDIDGDSGLDIIKTMKQDEAWRRYPVMLLSNYAEYQAEAIAAGAEPGFGKSHLHDAETRRRVARLLSKTET